MIYWVLHKKLTKSDWTNWLEGNPAFFFEHIENFAFLDISSFSWFAKIENTVLKREQKCDFDYTKLKDSIRYIKSKKDFMKLNCSEEKDLFVFQSYNNPRIFLFNQFLSKQKCKCLLLNHWQLPYVKKIPGKKSGSWLYNKIVMLDKRILFMRIVYRIFTAFFSSDVCFDFVLSCGTSVLAALPKNCAYKTVIPCHSVPYNEFLIQSKEARNSLYSEPYFVFIDQALTIHPDNKGIYCFTDKYREELLKTLDFISKQNGSIKIIIADHPRIQYPAAFWGAYEHLQGKTAELIMGAACVVGHFSTSVTLGFLAAKKLILLGSTSSYFPFNKSVDCMLDAVGGTALDMRTLAVMKEKCSAEINHQEIFSLIPDDMRLNDEIFLSAFADYVK